MIREDLLRRLDELVGRVRAVAWIAGEAPSSAAACSAWMDKWLTLQAELVAERCENCGLWSETTCTGEIKEGWGECGTFEDDTSSDDYCSRFEKKVW